MNNFKRSLSWLLSLVMLVSAFCICPVTATAADVWVDSGIDNTESLDSLDANPGRGWVNQKIYELLPDGTINRVIKYNDGTYDLVPYSTDDIDDRGTFYPLISLAAFSKGNDFRDTNAEYNGGTLLHVADHPELVGGVNMNLTPAALETLDNLFNDAREAGVAVVPHFAYAHSGYVGCEPSYFDLVLYHIKQLGELMTDHSDVILTVEAGMVGPWGEMHTSPYLSVNQKRDQVTAWLESLGNDIPVSFRTMEWITQYLDYYSDGFMALLPFASSHPASRLGLFNHGLLGDGEDCYTFIKPWDNQDLSWNLTRANAVTFLKGLKKAAYGGELASVTVEHMKAVGQTEWTPSKLYSNEFVKDLYDTHLTYLTNIGDKGITMYKELAAHTLYSSYDFAGKPDYSSYYGLDLQKFMYDHLGYRFVLRSAKTMVPSGTNTVRLQGTVENTGFANLLIDSSTQIILIDFMGKEHVYPVNVNANAWNSASTSTYDVTLTLPANATGSYRAFLKVNAANTGIQFANEGTWNSRLKANYIGTFTVGSVPGVGGGDDEDVEIDATADLTIDAPQLFAGQSANVKIKADATATITGGTVTVTYDKTKLTIPADTDADGSYDVTCGNIQKDGTIATIVVKPVANMSATTSITVSGTALTYGGYFEMNESTHDLSFMALMSGSPVSITKNPQNTQFNSDGLEMWGGDVALDNATGVTYIFKVDGVKTPVVANNLGIGYTITTTSGTTSKKTNNAAWDYWWQKNAQYKLTFDESGYYFMYVNAAVGGVSFVSTQKFWIFANLTPSGMDAAYAERANANDNATFQMLGITANNLQPTVNFYDDNGKLITTTTYKYTNYDSVLAGSDPATRTFDKLATPVEVFAASGATAPTKGSNEIVAWKDADGNIVEGVWKNVDLYPVWGYGEADATVTADSTIAVSALSAGQTFTVPVLVSGEDFIGATLKVTTSSNVTLTGINTTGTLFDGYVSAFADNIVLNAAAKGSDFTEDGVIVNLVLTAKSAIANGQTVSVTVEAIDMVNAKGESLGATKASTTTYNVGFVAPGVMFTTDAEQIFAGETENVTIKAVTTGTIIGGTLEITYDPTVLTIADDADADGKFTVALDSIKADGTVATIAVKAVANTATTASLTFGGTATFDKGTAKLKESVSKFNVIAVMNGAPVDITKNPENTEFNSDGLELWGGDVALHNSTGVTYVFKLDGIESPIVANNFQIGYTINNADGTTTKKTNNAAWDYWWQKNGQYKLTFEENGYYFMYVNAAVGGVSFISTQHFWIFANLVPNGMAAAYADRANANDNATFQMLGIAADNLEATVKFYDNDGNFITTATKKYTNANGLLAGSDANTRVFGKLATPAEIFATSGATAPTKDGYVLAGWADADGNLVEGVWTNVELYPVWEEEAIVEPEILYGDVNGDGEVNATDATLLTRYANKWDASTYADVTSIDAGDVNGDGEINATDATLLTRFANKWDASTYADATNLLKNA